MLPVLSASLALTGGQSTYAYTSTKGTVACESGKIRKDASTNSGFAYGVKQGDEITIINEKKGDDGKIWYEVQVGEGTGYIRSDLVEKSKTTATDNKTKETVIVKNANSKNDNSGNGDSVTGKVQVDLAIVRSQASTGSDVTLCVKQDSEVTINSKVKGTDGKKWYSVTVERNGISYEGYVRADLLKANGDVDEADYSEGDSGTRKVDDASDKSEESKNENTGNGSVQLGKIKGIGINVRKSATDGDVICRVTQGQTVTVTDQVVGSDGCVWYKISFTNNLTPQTGYIRSDFVEGVTQTIVAEGNDVNGDSISTSEDIDSVLKEAEEEENSEEQKKEEKKEETAQYEKKEAAINGINVNVRKTPGNGEVLSSLSTGSTVTVINEGESEDGRQWYEISYKFNKDEYTGWILKDYVKVEENKSDYTDALTGLVKGSGIRVRESAVNGTVVEQLNSGHRVNIAGETLGSDGAKWFFIEFTCKGVEKKGYIRSDYVNVITTVESTKPSSDADFEKSISCLPDSYKANLRALHSKYPNWQFEVVNTGLDWNEALSAESSVGKNLVAKNSISSWKSTEPQAYNWSTNAWYGFDGGTWASASKELIAYYMDPRNFLDESGIFQFEKLDCMDYQNEDGVKNIIAGTFMDSSFTDTDGVERNYVSTITEVSRETGISPYHLATRIIQEQGIYGSSNSISGTVPGYEGYFNYFNIGAYAASGRNATTNGLIYAKGDDGTYGRPWNSRYRSILGSAKYIAEKYVKLGQNTLYFEKFNVVNSGSGIYKHQYMSNVQAASSESARMRKAYSDKNTTLVFRIPVFSNMPDLPCEKPTSTSNPNNYLKGLRVDNYDITPAFSMSQDTYCLTVDNSVSSINITAEAVASTSKIGGIGTKELSVGTNSFQIVCKAQNGNTRTYTLNVQRN